MASLLRIAVKTEHLSRMKWECPQDQTHHENLLCFGTADMDFRSPEPILQAIHAVADCGHLGYPYPRKALFGSIHDWLLRATGWDVDVPNCMLHNVGIYTSMWNVIAELTQQGDEIIIQSPVHFCFKKVVEENLRIAVENPLKQVDGRYEMDYEHLEQCFSEKTKIFWLCNPHNPVGRAWTKEELKKLGDICLKHNVWIISDDVYSGLVHHGQKYVPIASISKELSNITVTAYSTSKTYNVTGLRYSYIITESPTLLQACKNSLSKLDLSYGLSLLGIEATIAAYNKCDEWVTQVMAQMKKNREYVAEMMQKHMPEVSVAKADATYFAWLDVRCLDIDPSLLATVFEQDAHMIIENGLSMGVAGAGYIRLNLACSDEVLQEGVDRMIELFRKYKHT